MGIDVVDLLSQLEKADIPFFLLRPAKIKIDDGDLDIEIDSKNIPKFENFLKTKYRNFRTYRCRYAFHTVEYELRGVSIDVKTAICFGHRKQIRSPQKLQTKGFIIENGFIFPRCDRDMFILIWYLHLILDKKRPQESTSFLLFQEIASRYPVKLSLLSSLAIVGQDLALTKYDYRDYEAVASLILTNLNLGNKILSSKLVSCIFRILFFVWRKLPFGQS